jgi:hypothetical protein
MEKRAHSRRIWEGGGLGISLVLLGGKISPFALGGRHGASGCIYN